MTHIIVRNTRVLYHHIADAVTLTTSTHVSATICQYSIAHILRYLSNQIVPLEFWNILGTAKDVTMVTWL